MSYIQWHGSRSDSWNVVVERYPQRIIPESRYNQYAIMGKNGDFIHLMGDYSNRVYGNYVQPYEIYLSAEAPGLEDVAKDVARWLYSKPISYTSEDGYFQLEDSYDPTTWRWAQFVGPVNLESTLAQFGRATIEFICKPQRFYGSGSVPESLSIGANSLTNPTYNSALQFGFRAKPILNFRNLNGGITITCDNGDEIHLDGNPAGNYTLDCERMTATGPNGDAYGNLTFVNSYNFPTVMNAITLTLDSGATVGNMYITPNWWTL